jgi:hypothetical protein
MPACAAPPSPKLTSMQGVSLAQTPSSSSFADWFKCGSRTRDTRFIRPLLYPSELTCGGVKQSVRAVRACATQGSGHKRARWGGEPTIAARSMFRPRHETPALRGLNSSTLVAQSTSHRPKRRNPGRQCRPGSHEEGIPGTAIWSAPQLKRTGLTHHVIQGTRGDTARNHKIPCVNFQRRTRPRAKVC